MIYLFLVQQHLQIGQDVFDEPGRVSFESPSHHALLLAVVVQVLTARELVAPSYRFCHVFSEIKDLLVFVRNEADALYFCLCDKLG